MSTDIIRSFLVSVGYDHDEKALHKLKTGINQASKVVVAFGVAVEAAAVGVAAGVARFAANLESLYFASQRTGTSIAALKAMDVAARGFGLSAGEAVAAGESLATLMRRNPGVGPWLNSMLSQVGEHIDYDAKTGQIHDVLAAQEAMGKLFALNTKNGNAFLNYQISDKLGWSEHDMLAFQNPDYFKNARELEAFNKKIGLEQAGKDANKFAMELRKLESVLFVLGVRIAEVLQNKLKVALDVLTNWAMKDGPTIATQIGHMMGDIVTDIGKVVKYLYAHRGQIKEDIIFAFEALKWVYENVVHPVSVWIIDAIKKMHNATGGLSDKILFLILVLSRLGITSVVLGIAQLGIALIGLVPGGLAIAGVAAALGGLYWAYQRFKDGGDWTFGVGGWVKDKVEDVEQWFHGLGVNPKLKDAVDQLQKQGMSKMEAIGLAVNMQAENSQFNPQKGVVDSDGAYHRGLMMWSPQRQGDYSEWAHKTGHEPNMDKSSMDDQIAFAAYEVMHGNDPRMRAMWKSLESHRQYGDNQNEAWYAASMFSRNDLRPKDEDGEALKRGNRASAFYNFTVTVNGVKDPKEAARHIKNVVDDSVRATRENVVKVQ